MTISFSINRGAFIERDLPAVPRIGEILIVEVPDSPTTSKMVEATVKAVHLNLTGRDYPLISVYAEG